MEFMTITDPSDWPSTMPDLKTIDTLLRCGICYEFFDIAMMLPQCSHNYCSICIRKYMNYKKQCPTCNIPAQPGDLCNNRSLDDLVSHFKAVRPHILKLCQEDAKKKSRDNSESPNGESAGAKEKRKEPRVSVKRLQQDIDGDFEADFKVDSETPKRKGTKRSSYESTRAKISSHVSEESSSPERSTDSRPASESLPSTSEANTPPNGNLNRSNEENIDPSYRPQDGDEDDESGDDDVVMATAESSTPSTSRCPPSTASSNHTPATRSEKAECPVCGVSVSTKHINTHLDSCLTRSEEKEARRRAPKRKPLPRLVSSLMSDKDLRKKLKEHGLNTQGNKQILAKRLHDFTMLYNAQCDATNPMPVEAIVQKFSKEERLRSQLSLPVADQALKVSRSQPEEEIAKRQKEYLKSHSNEFEELIKNARERMKGKGKRARKTNKDSDPNQSAGASSDSVSESDNAKDSESDNKHEPEFGEVRDRCNHENSTEGVRDEEPVKRETSDENNSGRRAGETSVSQDSVTTIKQDNKEEHKSVEGRQAAGTASDENVQTLELNIEVLDDNVAMVTREDSQPVESMDLTEDEVSPVFGHCTIPGRSSQTTKNTKELSEIEIKGNSAVQETAQPSGSTEGSRGSDMVPSPPSLLLLKDVDTVADTISEGSSLMTVETFSEASSYHGDVPSPQGITCIPESPEPAEQEARQDKPRRTLRRKRKPEASEEDDGKGVGERRTNLRSRKRGKTSAE